VRVQFWGTRGSIATPVPSMARGRIDFAAGARIDDHVTQVARPPTFKHTLGETDRCIAVDGEPLSVKGRRRQSTLTMPEFAFARQKDSHLS
jgi:hypothetical protein